MRQFPYQAQVNFGQAVWHTEPYEHPQMKVLVPRDFFDRKRELEAALPILLSPAIKRPIVILGERRAGKSSMLALLVNKLPRESFIKVEIPWGTIHTAEKLIEEILSRLYRAVKCKDSDLLDACRQVANFSEFQHMIEKLAEYDQGKTIFILIDEFDAIVLESITDEIQRRQIFGLLSLLIETPSLPVKIILTTAKEPSKLETGLASPLTAKAQIISLRPFPKDDLDEMIREIMNSSQNSITEDELQKVFDLSGGWPYYAKAIIIYLIQLPPDSGRIIQSTEKAREEIASTCEHLYLKHWDDNERACLLYMASRGGHISQRDFEMLSVEHKSAFQRLVVRGYLKHSASEYLINIKLLLDWFIAWPLFEEECSKYIEQIEQTKDIWSVGEDEIIEVSRHEVKRRGF